MQVRAVCVSLEVRLREKHPSLADEYCVDLMSKAFGDKFILPAFTLNSCIALGILGDFANSLSQKFRDSPA